MKITDVEAMVLDTGKNYENPVDAAEAHGVRYVCLIKVSTDEGVTGWSDVETQPHAAKAVVDAPSSGVPGFEGLRTVLLGEDPMETERLWEKMYVCAAYYGRAGVVMQAMSGIDIALWDIKGRATGLPIHRLLGAKYRDRVRAYASTLFRPTPGDMKRAVAGYLEQGYTAVKFGWGAFGRGEKADIALVAAARQEAGPDVDILVDAGWYAPDLKSPFRPRSRKEWRRVAAAFEDLDVFWIEDCFHPQDYDSYADLAAATSIRVAAGEQEATARGFETLADRGHVDVLQPDLSRCGGITVGRRVADLARERNIDCCCHAWLTDLLSAASLHLTAYQQKTLFLEFNVSRAEALHSICRAPIRLKGGMIPVPDGPGLGVEVDEAAVMRYRVA
jgi:L-rhamnonate dehydratase